MVRLLALYCLQLWAGTLARGLDLDDGVAWKQKGQACPVGPVSFRLGGGAVATGLKDATMDWTAPTEAALLISERSPLNLEGKTFMPTPGKNHAPIPICKKMNQNMIKLFGIAVVTILI